jgi:hypothetical protein
LTTVSDSRQDNEIGDHVRALIANVLSVAPGEIDETRRLTPYGQHPSSRRTSPSSSRQDMMSDLCPKR